MTKCHIVSGNEQGKEAWKGDINVQTGTSEVTGVSILPKFRVKFTISTHQHTSYLSHSSHVRHVEKNLSCGEISDFYTWQMGRNLINLAKFQISPRDRCGEL